MLCLVTQSCPTLLDLIDCSPPGPFVREDSPGKNAGVGCHVLLQGIFPTQGSNQGLLHCRQIPYQLSHQLQAESSLPYPTPGSRALKVSPGGEPLPGTIRLFLLASPRQRRKIYGYRKQVKISNYASATKAHTWPDMAFCFMQEAAYYTSLLLLSPPRFLVFKQDSLELFSHWLRITLPYSL